MKFGSRECVDLTFKTTSPNQRIGKTVFKKKYTPCFYIDTARTSTLEQQTTTVYAQGGRGFNRLIAWEGEKQVTFNIEDALISPLGLSVLTNAGLSNASATDYKHVHVSFDTVTDTNGDVVIDLETLQEETGLSVQTAFNVCAHDKAPFNAMLTDNTGAIIGFVQSDEITEGTVTPGTLTGTYLVNETTTATMSLGSTNANKMVKLDFYLVMTNGVFEITVRPEDFGGFFYVEGQTLFRREDTGEDMAAEVIIPRAKVQSAMTISMAPNGDPSTFAFNLDAFPAYTMFDKKKKVMFAIQVIGEDRVSNDDEQHTHETSTYTYQWQPDLATTYNVGDADDMEATNPTNGDYFYNTADTKLYKGNGSAWIEDTTDLKDAGAPTEATAVAENYGKRYFDTTAENVYILTRTAA